MNKDQIKGVVKEASGLIQQKTGEVMGNPSQQVKGALKQAEGQIQKSLGDVKEAIKDEQKQP